MAIYIQKFKVDDFRGIHQLSFENLNHVNLIVGDNNCGKTSVLESLLLLRNPKDFSNVMRIARQRDQMMIGNRVSSYENFVNLFPPTAEESSIGIQALCKDEEVRILIAGSKQQIMVENKGRHDDAETAITETEAFRGNIHYTVGSVKGKTEIDINAVSGVDGMEIDRDRYLNMTYLAPLDHVRSMVISEIVRNDQYKDICIHALQLFDEDIVDLLILRNNSTNRPVEYIKHRKLGIMPVSTYGDGIKKVLLLANAIAKTTGGVLLIDEVETAIHAKYYDEIFSFLVRAAMSYQVQLFITTHNLETVDALLATQDYENQTDHDYFNVMTLKKGKERTYARVLSGREVAENRAAFDFEVRL